MEEFNQVKESVYYLSTTLNIQIDEQSKRTQGITLRTSRITHSNEEWNNQSKDLNRGGVHSLHMVGESET